MKGLIFPYDTLGDALELIVKRASLITIDQGIRDEISLDNFINRESKTISLWQAAEKGWYSVELELQLSGARDDLEPFFQSSGFLTASASAVCRLTRLRQSRLMSRSATNRYAWEGVIEINRRAIAGPVKVRAVASGKAAGRDNRYIAESGEWTLYADSAYMPQLKGALPVRWIDFASDRTFGDLRKFSNEPYFLNLELPIPEVYLNKGFEGLPELFSDQSKPAGSRLAVHETLRAAIAKSVWLSLFQTALEAIKAEPDEAPTLPDQEWQVSVLQMVLPRIYQGYTLDSALQKVVEDRKAGDMGRVEALAAAVIGRDIVREGKAVRIAMQSLGQEYGGA